MQIDCANLHTRGTPHDERLRAYRARARTRVGRFATLGHLSSLGRAVLLAAIMTPVVLARPASRNPAALDARPANGVAQHSTSDRPASARRRAGCLADSSGYLRATIRGAVHLDLDWHNAELECEGSPRPLGRGLRLSFAGPLPGHERRLRLIFGVGAIRRGQTGRELPTNVTVIFEGERRLYATLSQRKCTMDRLRQKLITRRHGVAVYRVAARGFCIDPLANLEGDDRIVMSRFDFVGRITFTSHSS